MLGFCEWLASTAWSIALHESLYVYPLVETTHVLALCLFAGTITLIDLRLLGLAFRTVPVIEMTARVLPWTLMGFVIVASTGLALFYAIPVRTYQSIFFRVKMMLIAIAGINAWMYHRRVRAHVTGWDDAPRPPLPARISAAVSLGSWTVVIVTGRMIAYNWFDCDHQPQPAFVNWAAGCVIEAADGIGP